MPNKLLLVEDDTDLRETLETFLKEQNFEVESAADGAAALALLLTFTPDLIILDMMMPNVSGREFLDQLRDSKNATKVVCMSGYSDHPMKVLLSLGVNGFHFKPFDPEAMVLSLKELFKVPEDERATRFVELLARQINCKLVKLDQPS